MIDFAAIKKSIETPFKSKRLVISPSFIPDLFDSHLADCPFPFFHDGRFYMTYIGWDTIGYRTGLAVSDDLIKWEKIGIILDRGEKESTTEFNVDMSSILRENDLFSRGELVKIDRKFIGTYHAYPAAGYEQGAAAIGLCTSENLREWEILPPVLTAQEGADWEKGGLYKSWLMVHNGIFYLFYNAKNKTQNWIEQIGFAYSHDLKKWTRYDKNPVVQVGKKGEFDECFAADPCVFRLGELWVMFYYGYGADGHGREGAAVSADLRRWEKLGVILDIGDADAPDNIHAHKPGIIYKDGCLYHFYCAVSKIHKPNLPPLNVPDIRGISLAASKDIFK